MKLFHFLAALLLVLLLPLQVSAAPQVLATLKPLQLIAQAVVGDRYPVQVLLPPGATPHHYSLRPSAMRKLDDADLIIWLGAAAERYLAKSLEQAAQAPREINLEDSLTPDGDQYPDPHLWLSATAAAQIAQRIAVQLSQLDPAGAPEYQRNADSLSEALQQLRQQFLAAVAEREIRYLVYHDAYGYFAREYGLSHSGVVTKHPELAPGAKHLLQLQQRIAQQPFNCILVEPGSNRAIVEMLVGKRSIKQLMVDPMAGDVAVGPQGYLHFLADVMRTFQQCDGRA